MYTGTMTATDDECQHHQQDTSDSTGSHLTSFFTTIAIATCRAVDIQPRSAW
jgi:hypothetical protein